MASTRSMIDDEMSKTDISAFFTSRPSQIVQLTENVTKTDEWSRVDASTGLRFTYYDRWVHSRNSISRLVWSCRIRHNRSPNFPFAILNYQPNCSYNLRCLWWFQSTQSPMRHSHRVATELTSSVATLNRHRLRQCHLSHFSVRILLLVNASMAVFLLDSMFPGHLLHSSQPHPRIEHRFPLDRQPFLRHSNFFHWNFRIRHRRLQPKLGFAHSESHYSHWPLPAADFLVHRASCHLLYPQRLSKPRHRLLPYHLSDFWSASASWHSSLRDASAEFLARHWCEPVVGRSSVVKAFDRMTSKWSIDLSTNIRRRLLLPSLWSYNSLAALKPWHFPTTWNSATNEFEMIFGVSFARVCAESTDSTENRRFDDAALTMKLHLMLLRQFVNEWNSMSNSMKLAQAIQR